MIDSEALERKNELEDVKRILETPEGLRFFKRLMRLCHIFTTSFTGNSFTYFNEGQRNVGLYFVRDIAEISPASLPLLIIEQTGDNEND